MKLVAEAVDVTRVNAECEQCGGIYKAVTVKKHPTEYKHKCVDCGDVMRSEYEYPRIVYTTRTHIPLTTNMLGTSMFK